MQRAQIEKVDSMQEKMDNVSREMETLRNNQKLPMLLERHNLPKLTQRKIDNLNKPISIK